MFSTKLKLLFVGFFVVACSSVSPVKTEVSKENETNFNSVTSYKFKFRPFKEVELDNGLKILFIEDNSLPRVGMLMLVKSGAMQEPENLFGLNSFTVNLMDEGTIHRNAEKIADEFGQMGTSFEISAGHDFTTFESDALVNYSDKLLDLFSEIMIQPNFTDIEISRQKVQVVSALTKKVDDPSTFASNKIDSFIFGAHPYARDLSGTIEAVKRISKQDIINHYKSYYRPNNSSLAVVGKFNKNFEKKVMDTFSKWENKSIPVVNVASASVGERLQVKLYIKKSLKQSQIRISQLGIARTDKDYLALRLGNEILGGGFASRLNQKVRDDLGLTYSISSQFLAKKEKGSFSINTFSKNETSGKTFEESMKVIEDVLKNGVNEKEVNAGISQMLGQFPRSIETSDKLAFNLLALNFFGIQFDYLVNFNATVQALNVAVVNNALRKHIDPSKFKAVIYGNESIIPQFEKYHPEIVELP